ADELPPPATRGLTPVGSPPAPPPATRGLTPVGSPPAPPPEPCRPHATPVRLLFTIAVGFVAVFLFLRTFAVEPFGVPTGSMAPTLLGNHREAPCPRCGYPVKVGSPPPVDWARMVCPNCGRGVNMTAAAEVGGDRLLVDKNVFNARRPRRWEVAVFRCPDPKDPLRPYVKRVVGLPGETLRVVDGDVYADGELVRKSLAEVREARCPVFDMGYTPVPGGWGRRWLVDPPGADRRLPKETGRVPATAGPDVVQNGTLVLDAAGTPQDEVHATYRHWDLDTESEPVKTGITAWNSYDGPQRGTGDPDPVHDFSVVCTAEVAAVNEAGTVTFELTDGADFVSGTVPVGLAGTVHLATRKGGLNSAGGVALKAGKKYRVEFAFVDRRVSLAVDGKELVPAADLPPAAKRMAVTRPLHVAARGCRVTLRGLKIDRDIHYTQYGEHATRHPVTLGPAEFFVLGDNSGNSEDSRKWPHPGVPADDFIGKPFLIHQPLRLGRVTVGGRERVFQTLDWSRLRWVH
ncbi:MAG: S26 family signal peptidase, partial [Gemmataceae bacterium]|nr:S26 family signal peptidase [Gemmataceae bacterium]